MNMYEGEIVKEENNPAFPGPIKNFWRERGFEAGLKEYPGLKG